MSNRLTFSLASLIVLIAFGLVFGTTSVMAHDAPDEQHPDQTGAVDIPTNSASASHTHDGMNPVDAVEDDTATTDVDETVPAHNSHPTVMISLKPGDNISPDGKLVRIVDGGTVGTFTDPEDEVTFTLVIDFDQNILTAAPSDDAATPALTAGALIADDLSSDIRNVATIPAIVAPSATIGAPAAVGTDYSKFEATVTINAATGIPSGTPKAADETLTFRVFVAANAVYSLQTVGLPPRPGETAPVYRSAGNAASMVYEFTLVKSLDDEGKLPLTLSGAPAMNEITTLDPFNMMIQQLGSDGTAMAFNLTTADIGITNATFLVGASDAMKKTYTLAVTPKADLAPSDAEDASKIVISAAADSMYKFDPVKIAYTPPKPVATIMADADTYHMGKRFSVTVTVPSEGLAANFMPTNTDFMVTPAAAAIVGVEPVSPDPTGMKAWTVYIEPFNTSEARTLSVTASAMGQLSAAEGTDGTASVMAMPDTPAMPANLAAEPGLRKVTLKWTVVDGASYEYRQKSGTGDFSDYMDTGALTAVTGSPKMKMFDVTGLTGGMKYTFEVRVKASGMTPAGAAASITATPMSPDDPVTSLDSVDFTSTTTAGVTTLTLTETDPLPNSGFGIVQTHNPTLPDIHRFFAEGGTISVLSSDSTAKLRDVVISEIMWGLDLRVTGPARTANQFIELYDTTGGGADLTKVSIVFDGANTVPAVPDGMVLLDQVSNVDGVGWLIGDAPGQSGRIFTKDDTTAFVPMDLKSMYRKIDYAKVEKADHDADAAKNRTAQLKDFPNGNAIGSWAESDDADTYGVNLIGSPGAQHFVPYKPLDPTNVPRGTFVINEVGNHSTDAYDWVELRNVSSSTQNLRKVWRLSQVTDDKKDTALVTFDDSKDYNIAAGAVVLIVNSDPYQDPNHPLAAGTNITHGNNRAETTGVTSQYYVNSGLVLKNGGKTLLILRNSNDNNHLGKSNNIQDVIGTLSITDNSAGFRTKLWPLVAKNAPHGDVITDGPPEELKSGSVYVRNDAAANNAQNPDGGSWEHDLSTAGYTGVGYKRSAAKGNQHGGTPGYDNGAVKVNNADLADSAMISISEIMYAKNRNEPQWIELYNSSMTQTINLSEWKLKIEHDRDVEDIDIRTSVTTNNLGGGIMIQPNQTVLIVSNTTGRTSRASQGRIDFPATRIINLWGQKDKLEVDAGVTRLTYKLLSNEAFKLTLMDKAGTAVDVVGNLDAATAWDLPASENGEGRSSIIRRYTAGEPDDGTMEESWTFARDSHLTWVRFNETYYGSPDDIGTPGFRAGGPLPVSLSKFRPERLDNGSIRIVWITESELNNAGFNILRSEKRDGEFKQINTKLIAGQGTTSERTTYTHVDTSAKPNVVYYYQIQDVSIDGKVQTLRLSRLKGHISPTGKVTTTWGDIKALQ